MLQTTKENINFQRIAALNKILINHLQMVPLIQFLDFKWDFEILNFFMIQNYFYDVSDQISSFDCFISSKL